MRWMLAAVAAGALLVAGAPAAEAQGRRKPPAPKQDPKLAEAKKLFDAGADLYSEGDYEGAIQMWEQSYEISKKPLIFDNLANAYERLGNPKRAREYLVQWRDAAPPTEREQLDTRIKNLEARIAREAQEAAEEAARRAAQEKKERERARAERERKAREAAAPKISIPGVVLAGAGGAAVAAGVVLDVVAAGKRPDETSSCAPAADKTLCRSDAADAIESSNTLAVVGDVVWIAGAVAAAAGIYLIVTYDPDPSPDTTGAARIMPLVSPALQGASLSIDF